MCIKARDVSGEAEAESIPMMPPAICVQKLPFQTVERKFLVFKLLRQYYLLVKRVLCGIYVVLRV